MNPLAPPPASPEPVLPWAILGLVVVGGAYLSATVPDAGRTHVNVAVAASVVLAGILAGTANPPELSA